MFVKFKDFFNVIRCKDKNKIWFAILGYTFI